ncbi:MAG TPA: hypothetical protein GX520_06895 [Syntrophaceticus sp.]|nr:hypothetical protein [Syntrophaceticus sp.]
MGLHGIFGEVYGKNSMLILLLTVGICLLFAGNSAINLRWSGIIYPTPELYNAFLPNDYINLFIGVPALIFSVILALCSIKIGLIGWTGSLLFVLYNEIAYLFAVRNVYSIIVNATIVLLGAAAIILMLTSLDYQALFPVAPIIRRPGIYGAILILMGVLFIARALINIITAVSGNSILSLPEIGVNIADAVICPFWIISGILLFKKTAAGFTAGCVSYFHGSLLFIALIIFMVIRPMLCDMKLVTEDLLFIGVMTLIFLVPAVLITRTFQL